MGAKMQIQIKPVAADRKTQVIAAKWKRVLLQLLLAATSGMIFGACVLAFEYATEPPFIRERLFSSGEFMIAPVLATILAIIIFVLNWILSWLVTRVSPTGRNLLAAPAFVGEESKTGDLKSDDLRTAFQNRRSLKPDEILLADRVDVIDNINRRVERLVRRTQIILYAIGFALVSSAFIILFAGRLTSLDASAVSNIDRLKSDLQSETSRLSRLYQLQILYGQLDSAKSSATPTDKLQRQIDFLREDAMAPIDATSTTLLIEDQKKRVDGIDALLASAWQKELDSARGYSDWHYIAATAITRVGIVLIIVYLVQILMGLYRYNTRLIAYYNSRRDLLTLWDGKQRTLKSLDEVLSSSKIDFGREPKHPLEDLFRALGGKMNSLVSGGSQQHLAKKLA